MHEMVQLYFIYYSYVVVMIVVVQDKNTNSEQEKRYFHMKMIKVKIVSLVLGVGIAMSAIPARQVDAASPNSAIENTKQQIITMTDKIKGQEASIGDLSEKIVVVGDNIKRNETEIVVLNESITNTLVETEETKDNLDDKNELYAKRLREVYKNGNTSVISTLLSSKNLSDLMLRLKVVKNISQHDKELIDEIEALKLDLEAKTKLLQETRTKLETTTADLKTNQAELAKDKVDQEAVLVGLNEEKTKLRDLLASQEVALFDEIKRVLNSSNSTEAEVNEAMAILDTIQAQVSTAEAVKLSRKLTIEGKDLAGKLKAARLEAERLAKEKAEAERLAKELEAKRKAAERLKEAEQAKKLAAEQKKATELAAQKEAQRVKAVAAADKIEAQQSSSDAAAIKLAAEEAKAKASADQAASIKNSTTTPKASTATNNLTFYLTFYTDLPSENGGWTVTATGDKLVFGVVANNVWPLYTKLYVEGYGTMTVKDRGGSEFYSKSRLDVFIPRKSGESNSAYLYRVNMMGRRTVKGRAL